MRGLPFFASYKSSIISPEFPILSMALSIWSAISCRVDVLARDEIGSSCLERQNSSRIVLAKRTMFKESPPSARKQESLEICRDSTSLVKASILESTGLVRTDLHIEDSLRSVSVSSVAFAPPAS